MKTLLGSMLLILVPGALPSLASHVLPTVLGALGSELAKGHEPERDAQRQKFTTCLWFKQNAEEAIRLYTSIFADSKIVNESRWGEGAPFPKGKLMACTFELAGQEFLALDDSPASGFTESMSIVVNCETQKEVDELWQKLGAGGQPGQCGWLKDKFGVSWQIVPTALGKMLADKDAAKAKRVVDAMMKMQKLDIARLQAAYDQR